MTAEERIVALERRLRRIEDEPTIGRSLASYGPLVDASDADALAGQLLYLWALRSALVQGPYGARAPLSTAKN